MACGALRIAAASRRSFPRPQKLPSLSFRPQKYSRWLEEPTPPPPPGPLTWHEGAQPHPHHPLPPLALQEKAYAAAIASPDYQALLRKDEKPCFLCGNRESPFKECCVLDLSGPIAQVV